MNESLQLMKELLGIDETDASKDSVLNHYLQKAKEIILGYCQITELPIQYDSVVVDYSVYLYKNRDSIGLLRKSEGERSVIYGEGIPQEFKLALPLPRIRVGTNNVL